MKRRAEQVLAVAPHETLPTPVAHPLARDVLALVAALGERERQLGVETGWRIAAEAALSTDPVVATEEETLLPGARVEGGSIEPIGGWT